MRIEGNGMIKEVGLRIDRSMIGAPMVVLYEKQ